MGVAGALGFERPKLNPVQKMVARLASTRPVSMVNRRALPALDRLALRVSGGRTTVSALLSGLAPVWLSQKGRRPVPLLGVPVGDDIAVIGTGFGQRPTPRWVERLHMDPMANLTWRSVTVPVRARPATAEEEKVIWEEAIRFYPGYATYPRRAHPRTISVFVLEESAGGLGD